MNTSLAEALSAVLLAGCWPARWCARGAGRRQSWRSRPLP